MAYRGRANPNPLDVGVRSALPLPAPTQVNAETALIDGERPRCSIAPQLSAHAGVRTVWAGRHRPKANYRPLEAPPGARRIGEKTRVSEALARVVRYLAFTLMKQVSEPSTRH